MNQFIFSLFLSSLFLPPSFLPFHWPWLAIPLVVLNTSDGGSGQPEHPLSFANLGHQLVYFLPVCTVDFATSII